MNSRILMAVGGIALLAAAATAVDYSSTGSGYWTNAATWGGGGWPQNAGDNATISGGHTVTINVEIPEISSVTVNSTGIMRLYGTSSSDIRYVTQTVVMADSSEIRVQRPYGYLPTDKHELHGSLSITGTIGLRVDYAHLGLYSTIDGTGGLNVNGFLNDGNQRAVLIYGDSSFTGNVTLADNSFVYMYHQRALGSGPNKVLTIGGNRAYLRLVDQAQTLTTNISEVVLQSGGRLYQGKDTLVDCNMTVEGGGHYLRDGRWGDAYYRTNASHIVLADGFINTFHRNGDANGSPMGIWRQEGTISGSGALHLTGENGWDGSLRFHGSNTYSGGTYVDRFSNHGQSYAGHDYAFGTGPVVLQSDADDKTIFTLLDDLTMPNDFRGRGKIATGSSVLTTVGAISPRDSGLSTRTMVVGSMQIEDLKFGSDTDGCDFYWQYDDTTNDMLQVTSLQMGSSLNTLYVDWVGTNSAPIGEYAFMTYSSGTPDIGSWKIISSDGYGGKVYLDEGNKRFMVRLFRSGLVIIFR